MSTNYYARIIPSKKVREKLKKIIDSSDFAAITSAINSTFGEFEVDYTGEASGGEVHLGKRAGGWKFLWNPNVYIIRNGHMETDDMGFRRYVPDPDSAFYLYPLTKQGIHDFIFRDDVEIYDEYNEKQDKEDFWNMALGWTTWGGKEAYDAASYEKEHPIEKEFRCENDLTRYIKAKGEYQFTSKTQSDFYSDGLRFSTNTSFS